MRSKEIDKKRQGNLYGAPRTGRPKGAINLVTRDMRQLLQAFAEHNLPRAQGWLDRIAKRSPTLALKLVLEACEYCIPKLARTELVGDPNAPLVVAHTLSVERLEQIRAAGLADRVGLTVDHPAIEHQKTIN